MARTHRDSNPFIAGAFQPLGMPAFGVMPQLLTINQDLRTLDISAVGSVERIRVATESTDR